MLACIVGDTKDCRKSRNCCR